MNMITDILSSSEYIYSAETKWGLHKYVCNVAYFTEEPLDDLYYVICSILDSTEEKCYDKGSLGILLGFGVTTQEKEGKTDVYYDVAEARLFEDILKKVEKEHLIKIDENIIQLTVLGLISLKEGKHYKFFSGTQDLYEHSMLRSEYPLALQMFPFYIDMGIYTSIKTKKQIWPEDKDVAACIYFQNDQLKKRLELQSKEKNNIYYAEIQEYFDFEVRKVPVKLFKHAEEYIPVIMNNNDIAIKATELIRKDLNSLKRENIVLECLFQKLWDNKDSILNFITLEPYFELVDYEELSKDSRTDWTDLQLLDNIVDNANPTCWRNITRHCNINVLSNNIDRFKDNLDWPIISERIDDSFLIDNFLNYPWDLEVISEDMNRKVSVIERLILLQKNTEEDWNWEELKYRLSRNFIISHLDLVKIDLASFTNDNEDIHKAILAHIDKRWDWYKIETEFNLQFIYDHIDTLGVHLGFTHLFDRIFTDSEWSQKFASNIIFKNVIEEVSKEGGALSSSIFNDKEYLWTFEIIDLLCANGLLCWESTPYTVGFECNPHLNWTKEFFNKYCVYVTTEEGRKFVSSQVQDIQILIEASEYNWDWNAISSNKSLLSEMLLFSSFGKKLDWKLVFSNQEDVSFLQSINGIESMIGNDQEAWSAFSSIASIEYVINKYKDSNYPWDWSVLTERMFSKLKLDNLGNKLFIDKWDWTYLSEHVSVDFLIANLEKFSKYWNWEVSLSRIITQENRFDYNFLDNLAVTLTNIPGNDLFQKAWSALTSRYSFRELKKLIKETVRKRSYWWDMNYFCQHKDFNVFRDLEDCRNIVDWDILSTSPAVDASFVFNPKLGIKEKAWRDEIRKILTDERNRWNYASLSHFKSLRDEEWFISQYKEKIDWEYISQSSKIFCVKDKQQLNNIIEAFKNHINFKTLSERDDVDIEQIININPRADYNYNKLIENEVIKATLQIVEKMPDYPWDWELVSSSDSFYPTAEFLKSHIDCNLNWQKLSKQENQKTWSDEKLVLMISQNENIRNQVDWYALSSLQTFPLSEELLDNIPLHELNWKRLSERKTIKSYIDKYKEYIDWTILSGNRDVISLERDILYKYKDYLDWVIICNKEDFVFTNEILDTFADYIDWNLASDSKDIKFTKQLVEKYKDRWNWPVLVKNKAFNNRVDISDMPYAKQINIVDFISKFPRKPKAYHFTHMENAVKIIRAMKLQSRNYADGNFSNSAGSNVHRTNKAHNFARFYFVPKSPTQFYNECLGKDRGTDYYDKAYNLGLPKCPLPVFFVFDIEELLTVMPDLCYYSNGNMQKDSSQCFKVVTDPHKIKAREIYIDSRDTFDERQQEFLVEGELDFSKLRNVQICCYNDFQAQMLRNELKGTKWEQIITSCDEYYIHKNRELYFKEKEDSIEISTNYGCDFEFRVSYIGERIPSIVNNGNVLRQRGNNIYVASSVELKKDTPFEVFFEVNKPRIGSWLIFSNK